MIYTYNYHLAIYKRGISKNFYMLKIIEDALKMKIGGFMLESLIKQQNYDDFCYWYCLNDRLMSDNHGVNIFLKI